MSNTSTVSETTHIAKTTVIKGEVRLEGPATIAGRIDGGIFGKDIEVIADAHVEGDIQCSAIELNGNVKGNVTAAKSCKLGATARVAGELRTANLSISEGAIFVGQVSVGGPAVAKAAESTETAKSEATGSDDAASNGSDNVSVLSGNVQSAMNRNAKVATAPRPYTASAR